MDGKDRHDRIMYSNGVSDKNDGEDDDKYRDDDYGRRVKTVMILIRMMGRMVMTVERLIMSMMMEG